MRDLSHIQGRDPIAGHGPMFGRAFRCTGNPGVESDPMVHWVRVGGRGDSHELVGAMGPPPGIDCPSCMELAARMYQEWPVDWMIIGPCP